MNEFRISYNEIQNIWMEGSEDVPLTYLRRPRQRLREVDLLQPIQQPGLEDARYSPDILRYITRCRGRPIQGTTEERRSGCAYSNEDSPESVRSGISSVHSTPPRRSLDRVSVRSTAASSPSSLLAVPLSDGPVNKRESCTSHPGRPAPHFCLPCEHAICKECATTTHVQCPIRPDAEMVEKRARQALMQHMSEFEETHNEIQTSRTSFSERVANIRESVQHKFKELVNLVTLVEEHVLTTLSNMEEQKNLRWATQEMICDKGMKATVDLRENIHRFLTFRDVNRARRTLTGIAESVRTVEDDNIHFFYGPAEESIQSAISIVLSPSYVTSHVTHVDGGTCGEIFIVYVQLLDIIQRPTEAEETDEVSATVIDPESEPVDVGIRSDHDGRYEIRFFPKIRGVYRLSVYLNKEHISNSPYDISVQMFRDNDLDCTPKKVFGQTGVRPGQFTKPWGVLSLSDGRVLVSDRQNHRIQCFSMTGEVLFCFGTHGTEPLEFNKPAGMCQDEYGYIYICDKDNHRVQVIQFMQDNKYRFVLSFGGYGTDNSQLNYPWDIAVNNSVIAVSDTKNNCVKIFDKSGNFVCKFGGPLASPEGEILHSPRGVAFTKKGEIFVTEFMGNYVVKFPDWKLDCPKTVGWTGKADRCFNRPQGIAVDSSGRYAVADSKNHRIQIFDEFDNLVQSIGTYGKAPGEFDAPQDVAFTADGNIWVVDLNNNRIQIF